MCIEQKKKDEIHAQRKKNSKKKMPPKKKKKKKKRTQQLQPSQPPLPPSLLSFLRSTALPDGTLQKRLITLAQSTDQTISRIEASGGYSPGHFYSEARKLGLGAVAAAGKAVALGVGKAQAGGMGSRVKSTAGWLSAAAVLGSALVSVAAERGREGGGGRVGGCSV